MAKPRLKRCWKRSSLAPSSPPDSDQRFAPLPERRFAPLIVTARLPGEIFRWADGLRRAHFPAERNWLAAHVTLFHALPPSAEVEVRGALAQACRTTPPDASLNGLMNLGGGTAIRILSPDMDALLRELADRFHGLLSAQDAALPRLHITIQNKVKTAEARALQAELAATFQPRRFRFAGLALHRYLGGPWEDIGDWSFRG